MHPAALSERQDQIKFFIQESFDGVAKSLEVLFEWMLTFVSVISDDDIVPDNGHNGTY